MSDAAKPHGFARRALDQRGLRLHPFGVFLLKPDGLSGTLTAGLLTRPSRPTDHGAFAKNLKGVHQHTAKTGAVAEQQRHGHDSPGDSRHREEAAHRIAAERRPSFFEDFPEHTTFSR